MIGLLFLLGISPLIGCSSKPTPPPRESTGSTPQTSNQATSSERNDVPTSSTTSSATSIEATPAATPPKRSDAPVPTTSAADATAQEIIFEDIQLPMQADMVFRPFMITDRVRELDGKRVRISGYMLPDSKSKGLTTFILLKNTECKFGPGGQADHLIQVEMSAGEKANYRDDAVAVEGILKINPFQGDDGNTWKIYDLICDRVEKYRPKR